MVYSNQLSEFDDGKMVSRIYHGQGPLVSTRYQIAPTGYKRLHLEIWLWGDFPVVGNIYVGGPDGPLGILPCSSPTSNLTHYKFTWHQTPGLVDCEFWYQNNANPGQWGVWESACSHDCDYPAVYGL